jgi:hypothetical protein
MPNYALFLRDDPKVFAALSPSEIEGVIMRYYEWRTSRAAAGQVIGGHKLVDGTGKVLKQGAAGNPIDGPFTEAKEVMAGLFIIAAKDYDEAVAIAATCPHVDFGTIEIREIQPMRAQ